MSAQYILNELVRSYQTCMNISLENVLKLGFSDHDLIFKTKKKKKEEKTFQVISMKENCVEKK